MFVHSNIRSSVDLVDSGFLGGKSLEEKLENLRHVVNLGREVGSRWGVGEVVRWDHNEVCLSIQSYHSSSAVESEKCVAWYSNTRA